ncbi:MAG: rod shape-determining protein MreC [Oscillospiraceae bacterium]
MNFQSKLTKILVVFLLLLAGIMAYAAANDRLMSAPQEILGAVAVPFQKLTSAISDTISTFTDKTIDINSIIKENEELKEELNALRKKQVDYDKLLMKNKQYEELLSITENKVEEEMVSAFIIGRDGMDKFYSFTLDKGENYGIAKNDVVISIDGVVGVVTEVGANFAKVSTILSPAVSMGCFTGSELDNGIVSGSYDLKNSENCIMSYLPKGTKVAEGDIVSTTGLGSVFPKDLIVGTIEEVVVDPSGNSKSAVVKPSADIANVKMVFIITSYTY